LYSYLTIRSPFDGIITKRTIDPGDYVGQPGSNPLFIVEKPEILRLRVYVPETFVNSIPSSEMIPFTTESVVGQQFSAKLARKSGSIDPATRTELWEYEYDNSQMNLKPGMYAIANLQLHRPESTFVVPHAAVATTLERKFVIRIRNSEVEWVDVRQGIADENGMEIFGNLQEGDTILMRATDELKSGSMVKINLSKP
jgi:membrane fusion protein, multidrug efflux system